MAWTEPKTNWTVGTDDTLYNGDRFTYIDFNRIKNNILHMYEYARELYPIDDAIAQKEADPNANFVLRDGYQDRLVSDFVYADEFNFFEERLDFLNNVVGGISTGEKQIFTPNGLFPNADELNRLETLCYRLNDFLQNKYISRRRLKFRLSQSNNHMDL